MTAARTVNCPRCGTPVEWSPAARFRPFCSERCKMLDLGAWAAEKYKVAGEESNEQESAQEQERR